MTYLVVQTYSLLTIIALAERERRRTFAFILKVSLCYRNTSHRQATTNPSGG